MSQGQIPTKEDNDFGFSGVLYGFRECLIGTLNDSNKAAILDGMEKFNITDLNEVRLHKDPLVFFLIDTFSTDILKFLGSRGLKFEVVNEQGETALEFAKRTLAKALEIHSEDRLIVKAIKEAIVLLEENIAKGGDSMRLKDYNDYEFSAVLYANRECLLGTITERNKVHILKAISQFDIEDLNNVKVREEPLVFFLIDTFSPDTLKFLMEQGLKPEGVNNLGETPTDFTNRLIVEMEEKRPIFVPHLIETLQVLSTYQK